MEFQEKVAALKRKYHTNVIARETGVSARTVEGWAQGRTPSPAAAKLVGHMLKHGVKDMSKPI